MYTDPTAWSLVVQVIIGAVVSIPILISVFWFKVKGWFINGRHKDS